MTLTLHEHPFASYCWKALIALYERDGIDRMLGTAERMIGKGFEGMAAKMCAAARAGETDDRAAVLVWRR